MPAALLCLGSLLLGACRGPQTDETADASGPQSRAGAHAQAGSRTGPPTASAVPAAFALTPPARLLGSTVDAATGARLGGVRVWAGDAEVTSDSEGRFALLVVAGWSGPLLGETADGRRARLELRPLAPGPLEVVLRLVRP